MGHVNICFCFRNLTKSMLRKSSSCFGRSRKCYSKGKWAPRPRIFWPNAASGQGDPSISGTEMATNGCWDGGLISAQFRLFSQHSVTERVYPVRVFLWNTVLSRQVIPFITGPKETLTMAGSHAFNLAEQNLGHSQKDVISMAGVRVRGGTLHLHIHSVWVAGICHHWAHERRGGEVGGHGDAPGTRWSFAEKQARRSYSCSLYFLHIRGTFIMIFFINKMGKCRFVGTEALLSSTSFAT